MRLACGRGGFFCAMFGYLCLCSTLSVGPCLVLVDVVVDGWWGNVGAFMVGRALTAGFIQLVG